MSTYTYLIIVMHIQYQYRMYIDTCAWHIYNHIYISTIHEKQLPCSHKVHFPHPFPMSSASPPEQTHQLKWYLRLCPRSFIASISRARRITPSTCIILNWYLLSMGWPEETLKAESNCRTWCSSDLQNDMKEASLAYEISLCLLVYQWSKI